jgi:two-component system OmpR family response regulator
MKPATRILIVDDEVALAEALAAQLRDEGFEVDTAHNGADALRLARSGDYDAIVSDVLMPIMDGERLYEQLLSEKPRLAPRFIFMTAYSTLMASVARRFVRSRDADLRKPFTEAQLLASLARIIPPDRWPQPPKPPTATSPPEKN